MSEHIGKTCPFCRTEIREEDAIKVCPACGIAHHQGCWEENKGCTTFGCSEQHYEAQHTNPTDVCANCGAPLGDCQAFCPKCGSAKGAVKKNFCTTCGNELADGQAFCPKCGSAANAPKKNVCGKCGNELADGQEFCPKCGQKAGLMIDSGVNAAINQFNAGVQQTEAKKKKTPLIIGIIAAAVVVTIVLVILLAGGGKKDFRDMYPNLDSETWCTIASDGSYLTIDTNPYNEDSDDFTWTDYELYCLPADEMIQQINEDLGFSSALYEKMNTTTWSQGRQTESNDKYTVTWTYHPDKGLEVMYEFKN